MEEKYSNSVFAIYAVGIAWIVYGLIFPLYRLFDFLIAGAFSLVAYFLAAKILPKQVTLVEKPALLAMSKDEKINALIQDANSTISQIRKINAQIPDEKISENISEIETLTKKIFDFIIENPKELPSVRRFINYYLPTTLKLLDTYITLAEQGIEEENISVTKKKIADMLSTIVDAFRKQLDSLFAYTALDISAEISAMQGILQSEGLSNVDEIIPQEDLTLKL